MNTRKILHRGDILKAESRRINAKHLNDDMTTADRIELRLHNLRDIHKNLDHAISRNSERIGQYHTQLPAPIIEELELEVENEKKQLSLVENEIEQLTTQQQTTRTHIIEFLDSVCDLDNKIKEHIEKTYDVNTKPSDSKLMMHHLLSHDNGHSDIQKQIENNQATIEYINRAIKTNERVTDKYKDYLNKRTIFFMTQTRLYYQKCVDYMKNRTMDIEKKHNKHIRDVLETLRVSLVDTSGGFDDIISKHTVY